MMLITIAHYDIGYSNTYLQVYRLLLPDFWSVQQEIIGYNNNKLKKYELLLMGFKDPKHTPGIF